MTVRPLLSRMHRLAGLALALFLAIAGLTGAALAYREPLERWTAPAFHIAPARGPVLDPLVLRARAESAAGRPVDMLPLAPEAGTAVVLGVDGGRFDEISLDPVTGRELGRRLWGDISQGMVNLMPFLYRLHYSLAAGDIGSLLMGLVALVWTLDCFIGFALTLPRAAAGGQRRWWTRWRKAFGLSTASGPRLVYDSHRASGLWLWPILLLFAWSSVGFNLPQVFAPAMNMVFGEAAAVPARPAMARATDWAAARTQAEAALARVAAREGLTGVKAEWLRLNRADGQWIIGFRSDRDLATAHAGGRLYLDAQGHVLAVRLPTRQGARQTAERLLFSLHMGGVLGPAWRAALVPIGLGIAGLSITGVLIWWRKRQAQGRRRPMLNARGERLAVPPQRRKTSTGFSR